jgi:hypothetical protein
MFVVVWFPAEIGITPPIGDGLNVSELAPRYFLPGMQKALGLLIVLGMTGWFGFNVGLGGAALSALLAIPSYLGPLLIGIPILFLSLKGIKSWNGLAALTTIAVIVLVLLVTSKYSAGQQIISMRTNNWLAMIVDVATYVGYIAVFSVRSPDFTAGFASRRDLVISNILLCLPIILISLAGVGMQQGTGSSDLVEILTRPDGLAIGNLLIFLAVIAPSFTILYSGAPALKAATGVSEKVGMVILTVVGLSLAIARFDLLLIRMLNVLAALFPPIILPLAVESWRRRQARSVRRFPVWVWLPGALASVVLTFLENSFASLVGILVAGFFTVIYLMKANASEGAVFS